MNDAPVAQNGSASGNEDTLISGTLVATDVDNLTLIYTPWRAGIAWNRRGQQRRHLHLHAEPQLQRHRQLHLHGERRHDGSNTATVTLTVNPVNDAPVAQNGSASGNEDTQIGGTLVATDVDGLTLTYRAWRRRRLHGTVVVNADGTYTYTPNRELQRHRQLHLHGERRRRRLQHRDRRR